MRWPRFFAALVAAWLTVLGAQAINVDVPDDFTQCMPAVIGLNQSKGNVTILIREEGVKKPIANVSLDLNTTTWTWPAVDIAAGENFTILVTDRSPKRKTKLSQSLFSSIVDASPTNDDSCLSAKEKKTTGGSGAGQDGGYDEGGNDQLGRGPHGMPDHHSMSTVEVSVIASVLGVLLFALLALILIMCWRRRRESKGEHVDGNGDVITSHRIGVMGERLDRHQVVTLFSEDGRAEGQAILGREGDAGWSYMSRVVPGLQTAGPMRHRPSPSSSSRRGAKTKRYDDEAKDGDLPSYGLSEYEKRALPKYADRARTPGKDTALVLTTRHDSQGSRLTFSGDLLDPNGISPTPPRQSQRSVATRSGENVDDGDVIVFRPPSGRTLLPYERNRDADDESIYSSASNEPVLASSTAIQSHSSADYAGHRRSRSEVSLRRSNDFLGITPRH